MNKRNLNTVNLPDKRAIVLQSGGLDSNVCASFLDWAGFVEVVELFIDYGQSAIKKEREMAKKIAEFFGHEFVECKINLPWFSEVALVGGKVAGDGIEYAKKNQIDKESYVPLRNHVFISIAGSLAESRHFKYVCCGVNGSQDILGRPKYGFVDTHQSFIKSIEDSINEGSATKHKDKSKIEIITPLIGMSKRDVIDLGLRIKAPLEHSWSCYNNGNKPCMQCSSCIGRAEGFYSACVDDPLLISLGVKTDFSKLFR